MFSIVYEFVLNGIDCYFQHQKPSLPQVGIV